MVGRPSFIMLTLSLCLLSRGCSVFPMAWRTVAGAQTLTVDSLALNGQRSRVPRAAVANKFRSETRQIRMVPSQESKHCSLIHALSDPRSRPSCGRTSRP